MTPQYGMTCSKNGRSSASSPKERSQFYSDSSTEVIPVGFWQMEITPSAITYP